MYAIPPSKSLSAYFSQSPAQETGMGPSFEYYFADTVAEVDYHCLLDYAGTTGPYNTVVDGRADHRHPYLVRPRQNGNEDGGGVTPIFARGGDQSHSSFCNQQSRQQARDDSHWPLTASTKQGNAYHSSEGCQSLSHPVLMKQAAAGDNGFASGTRTAPAFESSVSTLSNSPYSILKPDPEWSASYPISMINRPPTDQSICEGDQGRLSDCDQPIGSKRLLNIRQSSQHTKLQCFDHGCNGRSFSCQANLLRHRKEQSAEAKTFHCRRCGRQFTRATARNLHEKRRTCDKIAVGSQSKGG